MATAKDVHSLIYVGLNSRVAALNRDTGDIVWEWEIDTSRKYYVTMLLLDDKHLIVSASGYTYCLDPRTGRQLWYNELAGYGTCVASIVALNWDNPQYPVIAAAECDAEAEACATATNA